MKKTNFFLVAFLIWFLNLPQAYSRVIVRSSTLQIQSIDNAVDLAKVIVRLDVGCTYWVQSGSLLRPQKKYYKCPGMKASYKISSQGRVQIEEFKTSPPKNAVYEASLRFGDDSRYDSFLSISANEFSMDKFNFDGKILNLYKVNAARIPVTQGGKNFFDGREQLKFPFSKLQLILEDLTNPYSPTELSFLTQFYVGNHEWSNRGYSNPKLSMLKYLPTNDLIYGAFENGVVPKILIKLQYSYDDTLVFESAPIYKQLSQNLLSELSYIELQ